MKNALNVAGLAALVLAIVYATTAFGAVSVDFAAQLFVLIIAGLVFWVAKLLAVRQVSWVRSPMHWAVAVFAAYAFARYLTSPIEYESRLELFQVGLYVAVYFLAASNLYRQRDRTVLIVSLMVLAVAESAYGFWQFASGADVVLNAERPEQYHGRASGTYICPNHLAGFLEIALSLLLARLVIHRSSTASIERAAIQKILEGFVVLVALAGIVTSLSRGGWIATTAALIVFLVWSWRVRAISPAIAAVALSFSFMVVISALSAPAVRNRLAETVAFQQADQPVELKDITFAGRTMMWRATLRMIRDRPVIGSGPGTWGWFHLEHRDPRLQRRPQFAHSDVLQLASDYGFVGFALVAAILGCFYWHAVRLSRLRNSSEHRAFAIGSGVAVSAILAHSVVDFNMHIPANGLLLVTLMGLTVAMENGNNPPRRVEMTRIHKTTLGFVLVVAIGAALWFGVPLVRAARATSWGNSCKDVIDWDNALKFYANAIALDPKSPEPFAKMGDIYRTRSALQIDASRSSQRQQLARQAIDAYRQSLALNPYQSEVMLRLAAAYELAGLNDDALHTYQQALAVDPNNGFNYMRLGIFYRHIGDDARATEAFEKSTQLTPLDSVAMVNIEDIRRKGQSAPSD